MPSIPDENKRTGSMRVRLSQDMLERFEALAKRYGMPVSTLAAFAIARFVQSEEMNRMVVMDTAKRQAKTFGDVLTDDRLERIFGPMFQDMFAAFQHSGLGKEGETDETPKAER